MLKLMKTEKKVFIPSLFYIYIYDHVKLKFKCRVNKRLSAIVQPCSTDVGEYKYRVNHGLGVYLSHLLKLPNGYKLSYISI